VAAATLKEVSLQIDSFIEGLFSKNLSVFFKTTMQDKTYFDIIIFSSSDASSSVEYILETNKVDGIARNSLCV